MKRWHKQLNFVSKHWFEKIDLYIGIWICTMNYTATAKLGDKERIDKEQIGVKEPFPMTNCQFTT